MTSIFVAAVVGATVPVLFAGASVPGTADRSAVLKFAMTVAYASLAGYVAVFILQVTQAYQAFLLGLGFDALMRSARRAALHYVGGVPDGNGTDCGRERDAEA